MDEKIRRRTIHRLKIIGGQVRGLERLVEKDAYCINIIQQSSAIKQALSSLEDFILENHLSTHTVEQVRQGKENKAVKEILKIYQLGKRK